MNWHGFSGDWTNLAICGAIVLGFTAWGLHSWLRKRPTPAELEQGRRALLQLVGKMGDGSITELQEQMVFYNYEVRGVEYLASQDISVLESLLPADRWTIVGPVSVKYDPRNPANSMILSEQWTGLRRASAKLES
jgi:hypothetical protein